MYMNTSLQLSNFSGLWRAIFTLTVAQFLLVSCIPFAIPLPWFPKDPYKNGLQALEHKNSVHRDDIIYDFGMPWAAINDSNFIYIRDKPSSFIIFGVAVYGGGGSADAGPMTHRDYTVSFYFDGEGNMKSFQTYADTGKHDFCFNNDVFVIGRGDRQRRDGRGSPGTTDGGVGREDLPRPLRRGHAVPQSLRRTGRGARR